jgi:hypothetical protein
MVAVAHFDEIRSLGFAGISGAYAAVGSATTILPRAICFTNDTQGSMMFSDDGATDKIFVKSGSFKLFDIQSNVNPQFDDRFTLPKQMTFYCKQLAAPVSGSVYIEYLF